ncbi:hypothetical protein EJD97_018015, partial [Solanum chilense]
INIATDESCVATCATNVAIDELSVATCDTNIAIDESCVVVHPWITPTEEELQMPYLITPGLVETTFDPVVDRVKMVLAGATTIKREREREIVFDGTAVADGAGVGAAAAAGVGAVAGVGVGQHEGATSCKQCCGFLCEKC